VKQPILQPPAKSSANKKKHPAVKGFVIAFSLWVILAGLFLTGLYFNFLNLKSITASALQLDKTQQKILAEQQLEIDTQKKYLSDSLAKLETSQTQLKSDQAAVEKQKEANSKDSAALSASKLETAQLVAIFASMPPQKAADILEANESTKQAVIIIKNMDQASAAKILSLMTPAKASKILTEITN